MNRATTLASRAFTDALLPRAAGDSPLGAAWEETRREATVALERNALHEWLGALWGFVGAANKFVDTEKPWELAKAAKLGDAAAEEKLRGVLGDLLESCRLISLYAAPAMPTIAAKIWTLLGRGWPYDANGHNGPSLDEIGAWGALGAGGPLGAPEPLFPRLEADALDAAAD